MKTLQGKVALVTGASAGIGRHIAIRLANEGMHLVLVARSEDKLKALASELETKGIRAIPVPADVSQHADLEKLIERASEEFGSIDVLVNNAGMEAFHPFESISSEQIEQTLQVNLVGTLWLTRLVLPGMLQQKRGHIVNISSTAGIFGPAYGGAYGASKAGMIAFTQSLRGEYRKRGISASAICPGFTDEGGIYEEMKQKIGKGTPALMGSTSSRKVASAVVKALRTDAPQLIVNHPPMRPIMLLSVLFPKLAEKLVHKATLKFLAAVAKPEAPRKKKAA